MKLLTRNQKPHQIKQWLFNRTDNDKPSSSNRCFCWDQPHRSRRSPSSDRRTDGQSRRPLGGRVISPNTCASWRKPATGHCHRQGSSDRATTMSPRSSSRTGRRTQNPQQKLCTGFQQRDTIKGQFTKHHHWMWSQGLTDLSEDMHRGHGIRRYLNR